jgi:hypothetical protein
MVDPSTVSRQEKYSDIEYAFWEDGHAEDTEVNNLLIVIVRAIRNHSLADHLDEQQYKQRLYKAADIVSDIRYALTNYYKDAPSSMFMPSLGLDAIREKPDKWSGPSPVDAEGLDAVTARYLKEPWMQLDRIDWYILNAFIFNEMAHLSDAIKSGLAFGTINWAYVFGGSSDVNMLSWRLGLSIAKFCIRWLALPAVAGLLYYLGYMNAAKWVLVAYGVYVAFHLVLFPWHYMRRRRLKKQYADLEQKLKGLIQIYQSVSASTLNPTRLREQIAELEKGETFFKPAVYAILDRAIARDPAVLVFE